MLGGPAKEMLDRERLAGFGVRICLQGHLPIMAALQAVHDTLKAMRSGDTAALPRVADKATLLRLKREESYRAALRDYVGVMK
jgi:carboxyvinyl-carboxyphosphonate phosphorylmutase